MNARPFCHLPFLFVLASLSTTTGHAAESMRTWTNISGTKQMQAIFERVDGEKVVLRLKNNAAVTVEINQLSEKDQKYIEKRQSQPEKTAKPPAAVPEPQPNQPPRSRRKAKPKPPAAPEPGWSTFKTLPSEKSDTWPLSITAAKLDDDAAEPERVISLSSHITSECHLGLGHSMALSPSGTFAACSFHKVTFKLDEEPLVLLTFDVPKGDTIFSHFLPLNSELRAISDDGSRLMCSRRSDTGGELIEVWTLNGPTQKLLAAWPPELPGNHEAHLNWAKFVDNERLLTASQSGRLVCWNLTKGKPDWYFKGLDHFGIPRLSPDKQLLVCGGEESALIIDLEADKLVAQLDRPKEPFSRFCFSRDGSRLVCRTHSSLSFWNLVDGRLEREISLSGLHVVGDELLWPEDRYLLIGHAVVDIENHSVAWGFVSVGQCDVFDRYLAVAVQALDKTSLVLVAVPQPVMEAKLKAALELPDYFVLKPGGSVKLNVDKLPSPAERDKARATLSEKLQAANYEISPSATIEVVAAIDQQPVNLSVQNVNPTRRGIEMVQTTAYNARLDFLYQGKPLWSHGNTSLPSFLVIQAGQTVAEAVRAFEKPNYSLFEKVELPKQLVNPLYETGVGATAVTADGVKETKASGPVIHLAPGQSIPQR